MAPWLRTLATVSSQSRAAGLKAAQSRWANDIVQVCREACGGAGFISSNQLTQLRSDVDIFATFEGDNTVLMQLVARGLLTGYRETGWCWSVRLGAGRSTLSSPGRAGSATRRACSTAVGKS